MVDGISELPQECFHYFPIDASLFLLCPGSARWLMVNSSSLISVLNRFTAPAERSRASALFGLRGKKKCWVAGDLLLGWKAEEPRPVSPHPLHPPTSACMSGCDNYAPTTPLHCPHLACLIQREKPRLGSFSPSAPARFTDLPRREDWKNPGRETFLIRGKNNGQLRNAAFGIFHVTDWHRGVDHRDYPPAVEDVSLHRGQHHHSRGHVSRAVDVLRLPKHRAAPVQDLRLHPATWQ